MDAATALILIYRNGYMKLLEAVAKRTLAGKSTAYQRAMANDVRAILGELDQAADEWIRSQIPKLYKWGVDAAALPWTMHQMTPPPLPSGFAQVHRAAVEVIAGNMADQLHDATTYIGRRAQDAVRKATLETVAEKYVTGRTLKETRRELVGSLVDEGLTAVRDASGREWRLDTYAEMVTRTTTAEAANAGLMNQLKGYGHDLVRMTEHRAACPICAPYESRVFSVSGKTPGYPPLNSVPGFDAGYRTIHPNCRHAWVPYLPEYDEDPDRTKAESNRPIVDERSDKDKAAYAREQKMKGLRRQRKRLEEKVAVLPKGSAEYRQAREKLREVRAEQQALGREHRQWKLQAAKENREFYAARDAGVVE